MRFIICGPSGAGKSTLLKEISKLGPASWSYIDLDQKIAQQNNIEPENLGEFINEIGLDHFRSLENCNIDKFFEMNNSAVLAIGAGAASLNLIKKCKDNDVQLLFLDTPIDICWDRVKNDPNRPLTKNGQEFYLKLYKERLPVYQNGRVIRNIGDLLSFFEI